MPEFRQNKEAKPFRKMKPFLKLQQDENLKKQNLKGKISRETTSKSLGQRETWKFQTKKKTNAHS